MAVKRALIYRAGHNGPGCAAAEVAIEPATKGNQGSIRGIRNCKKPATVVIKGTAFCADCGTAVSRSSEISVVRQIRRGDVID
jgi:hypothetical protein